MKSGFARTKVPCVKNLDVLLQRIDAQKWTDDILQDTKKNVWLEAYRGLETFLVARSDWAHFEKPIPTSLWNCSVFTELRSLLNLEVLYILLHLTVLYAVLYFTVLNYVMYFIVLCTLLYFSVLCTMVYFTVLWTLLYLKVLCTLLWLVFLCADSTAVHCALFLFAQGGPHILWKQWESIFVKFDSMLCLHNCTQIYFGFCKFAYLLEKYEDIFKVLITYCGASLESCSWTIWASF